MCRPAAGAARHARVADESAYSDHRRRGDVVTLQSLQSLHETAVAREARVASGDRVLTTINLLFLAYPPPLPRGGLLVGLLVGLLEAVLLGLPGRVELR